MSSAEDEIRSVIDARLAAIRRKDAVATVESLSADIVAFEMVPPLALPPGAARDADAAAAWLGGFEEISVEVRDLHIEADGSVGFARALHNLTGTRSGGRRVDLWMRSTLCFRREEGGWTIAHSHTSVPFYPGPEMRAAVDLVPVG